MSTDRRRSSDQTEYELFISYARKDNVPILDTYPHGWVTALRNQILADQRSFTAEPLRIFFDTDEIKDMDDGRGRRPRASSATGATASAERCGRRRFCSSASLPITSPASLAAGSGTSTSSGRRIS